MASERNVAPAPAGPGLRVGADLWPRAAAAVVLASAALAAAWVGGFVFVAFWWAASAIVFWEWQRLIRAEKLIERIVLGVVALTGAAVFALNGSIFGVVVALVVGAGLVGWLAGPGLQVWAGFGTIYAGSLAASLALLRLSPSYGFPAVLWLFAVVWGSDIAAYFAGRLIGGPKLWVRVSPGKTWSGAVVGALAGAVLGLLLAGWTNRADRLFWLGLAAAVVSQFGDLFESAVKRRFGTKDSSGLIPGHGGLMDRLDAFIAASVFAAVFAALHTRGSYLASGLFEWP